jgi:membrane protease YdiL (CAAX protease family)
MAINEKISILDLLQRIASNPIGIIFLLLYLTAVVILLYQRDLPGLILGLGTSAFSFLFALLALKVTEGIEVRILPISRPWLGLAVWLIIDLASLWISYSGLFPTLTIKDLEVGDAVFRKLLFLLLIPLLILWAKGDPLQGLGLSLNHWQRNLRVALLLCGAAVVPVFLFGYLSWGAALFQQVTIFKALLGFPIAYAFYFFHTGLPEEFFFRAHLQGHLVAILNSRLGAVLLASMIFGLLHILFWRGEEAFSTAFAYSILVQVSVGVVFGVLWERARSLIPAVLLHALIDSILGLGYIVRRIF